MQARTIQAMARPLRRAIGAHFRLQCKGGNAYTSEAYGELRRASDEAVSLAKYLIQHLDSRHDAARFAHAVGMPGYINNR